MAYIGAKPTNVPLTSDQLSDNIITSSKIVDGAITSSDLTTSGVTAGSYTNASVTVNDKGIITAASSGAGVSTTYGAIGTYVIAAENTYTTSLERLPDTTVAGSNLVRSTQASPGNAAAGLNSGASYANGVDSSSATSLGLTGTWRRMTRSANSAALSLSGTNLYVRVS